MIEPEPLQQIDRTCVLWRRRKLAYFSGCDYFRLSSHPKVIAAIPRGLKRYGLTVSASRLTTGNHILYQRLEKRLASFFKVQTALLVPNGYATNLIVAQALAGQFSHALVDEMSHVSLRDALQMLECPVLKFRHRSPVDLASSVARCGPGAKLILVTDGLFSRDGSVAPLKDYLQVLPSGSALLVDDAHGAGILGKSGRGSIEHTGAASRNVIQTITLSKALGSYGGAILGTTSLRRRVLKRSHLFVGSTPLPLPLAYAALQSLKILASGRALRTRLFHNANQLKSELIKTGFPIAETPGPIIAVRPRHAAAAAKIRHDLLNAGLFPPFLKYPGGPSEGYFRFVISSEHSPEQLARLLDVLIRNRGLVGSLD